MLFYFIYFNFKNYSLDLHADALLWSHRPLLTRVPYGHVDVERLIEGNVALQVFGLVTSSPKGQNVEKNYAPGLHNDSITLLALAQRWGLPAIVSTTERALAQARHLHEKAAASNGTLVVVEKKHDLAKAIQKHLAKQKTVAGVLGYVFDSYF